jgi:hypothetical protein
MNGDGRHSRPTIYCKVKSQNSVLCNHSKLELITLIFIIPLFLFQQRVISLLWHNNGYRATQHNSVAEINIQIKKIGINLKFGRGFQNKWAESRSTLTHSDIHQIMLLLKHVGSGKLDKWEPICVYVDWGQGAMALKKEVLHNAQ